MYEDGTSQVDWAVLETKIGAVLENKIVDAASVQKLFINTVPRGKNVSVCVADVEIACVADVVVVGDEALPGDKVADSAEVTGPSVGPAVVRSVEAFGGYKVVDSAKVAGSSVRPAVVTSIEVLTEDKGFDSADVAGCSEGTAVVESTEVQVEDEEVDVENEVVDVEGEEVDSTEMTACTVVPTVVPTEDSNVVVPGVVAGVIHVDTSQSALHSE